MNLNAHCPYPGNGDVESDEARVVGSLAVASALLYIGP